jgi:hypothetical protein
MNNYFLLIKEVLKNKEYIWNTTPVSSNLLEQSLHDVCSQLKLRELNINLIVNVHDLYAEIMKVDKIVNYGYIWNSTQHINEVLYLVSAIPIHFTPNSVSVETQTCLIESDSESIESDESPESSESISRPFYLGSGYSNNILFPWTDKFKIELEEKLLLPNLGLRPLDQVYYSYTSNPTTSSIILDY